MHTSSRLVLRSAFSAVVLLALIVGPATSAHAATPPTVVSYASTDWVFDNDQVDAPPLSAPVEPAGYVTGPGTPPEGTGSLYMEASVAAVGTILATQKYQGTRLADITSLSYYTYTTASPKAITFQFNYDPDVTTVESSTWYGRLVFEPYRNGTVTNGVWQSWDMINSGGAMWWATGSGLGGACSQGSPCTLTALLAGFPNVGIRNDALSGIDFKAGSGWTGFTGAVDRLYIEIGTTTALYDFEAPSVVYVDDGWTGTAFGADPDSTGPANYFGGDAFDNIQDAVDAVGVGGTVQVADGTYAGNILVNKAVSILGDPGDAAAGPGASAPLIDGASTPGSGFFIDNGVANVTIKGFEIANFTSNDSGIGNGISAWEASTSYITIQDNYFHDLGWDAVLVGNDGAIGDHTFWMIKANVMDEESQGGTYGYGFELTNASSSNIEDNVIHATDSFSVITILARRSESDITIKNNTIDGTINATGRAAIYMYAYDLETAAPVMDAVLIEGNTINVTGGLDIRIRDLNLVGAPETGGTMTGVQLVHNSIVSFKNDTAAPVDAQENWWGSLDPATVASRVTGTGVANVDFTPWCTDATCTAFVPPFPTITTFTDLPDPSPVGTTVTFNFNVAGELSGGPMPSGTVNILDDATTICTDIALDGSGNGSCTYAFAVDGLHTLQAEFTPTNAADFEASSDVELHMVHSTLTYQSLANTDGHILETSETSGLGGAVDSTMRTFIVGDDATNKQYRSILSFNTASIPDEAVISSAKLTLRLYSVTGVNPFFTLGRIWVDIKNGGFGTSLVLQPGDFSASPSQHNVASFGNTGNLGSYSTYLDSSAFGHLNRTGVTQLRLRFWIDDDNDSIADYLKFYSGDHPTVAVRPALVISYYVP